MLNPDNFKSFFFLIDLLRDILLGAVGGIASYLFDMKQARDKKEDIKFSLTTLSINVFLGCFVGYMVGTLLDASITGRDAIVSFSGFTAFGILVFIQSKFAEWLYDKIIKKD